MLVLSRKEREKIMIGDIELEVVEIKGNRVRLGIEAGPEFVVHRKEFYEKIINSSSEEIKKMFHQHLSHDTYDAAYNLLRITDKYSPSPQELSTLVSGLEQKGLLNAKITEYLRRYDVPK